MEVKKCRVLLAFGLVLLVVAGSSAMSIEAEPVKVTHRNSGPRYDIDRDEEPALVDDRTKLTPVVGEQAPPTEANSNNNKDAEQPEMPEGHIHVRRIFLVPMNMMQRPANIGGWQPADNRGEDNSERAVGDNRPELNEPPMFAKPFWPFLTPARPAHHHARHPHLFGADEASRSPTGARGEQQDRAETNVPAGGEREGMMPPARHQDEPDQHRPVMFDPIQMMMDLMRQAIEGELAPQPQPPSDLNKEAATSDERPKSPAGGSELIPSMKPAGRNETREDVVEIEGKKFLRKTVINRHVGENIIFMTKRLIFVPLNETEPATTTVASSNEQPAIPTATTTTIKEEPTTTTSSSIPMAAETVSNKDATEEATTTTTTAATTMTTTTTTTEQPPATTEVVVPEQQPSSTPAAAEPTTRANKSWVTSVSDAIDNAAERLVESAQPDATTTTTTTTTTSKPESN